MRGRTGDLETILVAQILSGEETPIVSMSGVAIFGKAFLVARKVIKFVSKDKKTFR